MADEYTLKYGINYRADGFAFCDRCGKTQIVNRLCIHCDVTPTKDDALAANEIRKYCYSPRMEAQRGLSDGRLEKFDAPLAARVIAAMQVPTTAHCNGCGGCLDCIRRESYFAERVHGTH